MRESTKLVVTIAMALVIAACSAATDEVNATRFELSETQVLQGFGHSIDYPAGWLADTQVPVTVISELVEDHQKALRQDDFDGKGYQIIFDHRDMAFMEGIGLPQDPTLDDLLDLNKEFFEWQEPIEVTEQELFGVPTYGIETQDGSSWGISLMGIRDGEAFLLTLGAASEEARDAFRSTWERMLESISPTE